MLFCWCCESALSAKLVERDGILRVRTAENGGPFRIYRCPHCLKLSKVETTRGERFFASPEREFSAVDYLFGWMELLSPTDFLRVARWHNRYADLRRDFFEQDGDGRYSGGSLSRVIRRLLRRKVPEADLEFESWKKKREEERRDRRQERDARGPRRRREPLADQSDDTLPHPYRILGVRLDATAADIRTAFKRLVRRHHPDKQSSRDPKVLEEANRRLQELLDAYEELKRDPG